MQEPSDYTLLSSNLQMQICIPLTWKMQSSLIRAAALIICFASSDADQTDTGARCSTGKGRRIQHGRYRTRKAKVNQNKHKQKVRNKTRHAASPTEAVGRRPPPSPPRGSTGPSRFRRTLPGPSPPHLRRDPLARSPSIPPGFGLVPGDPFWV
jgi:hypothetical protein